MKSEEPLQNDNAADLLLVEAHRTGYEVGSHLLYVKYYYDIYGIAARYSPRHVEVEEWAQQCFAHVVDRLLTFKGGSTFYTWMYKVANTYMLEKIMPSKWADASEQLGNMGSEAISDPPDMA